MAHNFHFLKYEIGDTREHQIVLETAQNTKHNTHRHNNQQDEPYHPTHNFHFSFLVKCDLLDVDSFSNESEYI